MGVTGIEILRSPLEYLFPLKNPNKNWDHLQFELGLKNLQLRNRHIMSEIYHQTSMDVHLSHTEITTLDLEPEDDWEIKESPLQSFNFQVQFCVFFG